jgi:glycosyltransferase involved in cell wall biosynthesis
VDGSKARKLWTFAKSVFAARSALRHGVDVVHIHFASEASSVRKEFLARRALAAGVKVIMHAHGAEYRRYWQQMSPAQQRRTLDVLKRVSALIVLGDVWRQFFTSIGVPADRIVVMPNPVNLPPDVPDRRGRTCVQFAFLGIIDQRKGAFDLFEAIRGLAPQTRAKCRFVFAGNGEAAKLRMLITGAELAGLVEVRDWITPQQRDQLLSESDAFILPSRNEGMPMAMLEAMAWGLPVICTPVGSIPEVITDGDNGLMVPPGDVAAIRSAIERLVGNESERLAMGQCARRSVASLSTDRYVARLVALYESQGRGRA